MNIQPLKQKPQPQIWKRVIIGVVLFVLLGGAIAAAAAIVWYNDATTAKQGDSNTQYAIEVVEGDTLLSIAPKLVQAGLLKSVEAFQVYLRLNPTTVDLQVGVYKMNGGLNVADLLNELNEGPSLSTVIVTLPEAWRYDEMSDAIAKSYKDYPEALFKKSQYDQIAANPDKVEFSQDIQSFLDTYKPRNKSLEGFLFPDTYVLATDANAQDVIELQVRTLIRRLQEAGLNPAAKTKMKDFYEVLNLASIVEREALLPNDMRIVADIFIRRIKIGEIVGSDAPLLYLKKDWGYALTREDILDASDPYNTRARTGLPPTPIANPGLVAIQAVFNPKASQFLYFVSADGKNYYAKDLPGHCQNVVKYLGGSC